jgi:hypothetical protein
VLARSWADGVFASVLVLHCLGRAADGLKIIVLEMLSLLGVFPLQFYVNSRDLPPLRRIFV